VAGLPPALFAGVRWLAAGFLLLLVNRLRGEKAFTSWPAVRTRIVVGLLLLVGGNGLLVWAEQWVPSGAAALLVATVPLFMAVLDAAVPGGSRPGLWSWVGLAVGLAGVAILSGGPALGGASLAVVTGVLGGAFLWAAGSVYAHRHETAGSFLGGAAVEMLAGGIVLTMVGLLAGEGSRFHPNAQGWEAMVYLVLFGSLAGYISYGYALQHLPAARVATYAYVNPVVAVLLGSLVLGEVFTLRTLLAAAVILGGVLMVQGAGRMPAVRQNGWFRKEV